ncbi:MAG: hypothetical protein ACLT98_03600 [Eggerthellaceae bacterium]
MARVPSPWSKTLSASCSRLFTQLQNQGATFDAYLKAQDITPEDFKEDVKLQAIDNVKENLALDAWARHAGIEVTDEDILDEFKNSGAEDTDALFAEWKSQGRLHIVREGIIRGKALEALLKEADIEEVEQPLRRPKRRSPQKRLQRSLPRRLRRPKRRIPLRNSMTHRSASRARRMFVR